MRIIRRKMGESRWKDVRAAAYRHTMTVFDGVPAAVGLVKLSADRPVCVGPEGHRRRVVDEGYLWLQLAPENGFWWLTAMYDEQARFVEFYFDVTAGNHIEEDGESWFDDLFVDVVFTPGEPPRIVDADELALAQREGLISCVQAQAALAQAEAICREFADPTNLEKTCEALLQALKE